MMSNHLTGVALAALVAAMALSGDALASPSSSACTVVEVGVFPDRVHIRCSAPTVPGGDIVFFAISSADELVADRFVSMGMSALVSGRPMFFTFDTDYSIHSFSDAPGCLAETCRIPTAFFLQ